MHVMAENGELFSSLLDDNHTAALIVDVNNPSHCKIKVTPIVTSGNLLESKYLDNQGDLPSRSKLRWFNNMVRHMNIEGLCYDCWLCDTISKSMLLFMGAAYEGTGSDNYIDDSDDADEGKTEDFYDEKGFSGYEVKMVVREDDAAL